MPIDHKNIRVLALALIKDHGRFLACAGFNKLNKKRHFRLLGGGVEFGESGIQALRREIKEELGLSIFASKLISIEENRFVFNGLPGHEIVFLYQTSFRSKSAYSRDFFPILDSGGDFQAEWFRRADLKKCHLYPRSAEKYI
jgi:8-oxo-dGTP pyrophosphatase MutT (NUDIX family)